MGFKSNLKNILKENFSEEELDLLPSGFQTLGKIMIIKLNSKLIEKKDIIGNTCLELNPYIKSVYVNLGKISGIYREPEKMELIAGENNPIVEHKEHDIIYKFNITKIMFSKGNVNERKFLATLVKENEIIVDMFAGIGYFSLPIAKHSKVGKIFSIELNPLAYTFLEENIRINHLEDKIIPILGDSNKKILELSQSGIKADRVIMGVFPAPKEFIKSALSVVNDKGTVYHYEGVIAKEKYLDLFNEFKQIALKNNIDCQLLSHRFVKSYGPNLYHVVLDIMGSKK